MWQHQVPALLLRHAIIFTWSIFPHPLQTRQAPCPCCAHDIPTGAHDSADRCSMPPILSLNHAATSGWRAEKGSPRSFRIDDGSDELSRGPSAGRCA